MTTKPEGGSTPWWKPTLDSQGRLVSSKKQVTGIRRYAEMTRNALIVAFIFGALTEVTTNNAVATGVVGWIAFLIVFYLQSRPLYRGRRPLP